MVQRKLPSLSVFVPAYQVEGFLESTLKRIPHEIWEQVLEVVVLNDGSKDNTEQVALECVQKFPNTRVVSFEENQGYGEVVLRGAKECLKQNPDYILCLHGDGQYSPEKIPELLACIHERNLALVQGSRIAGGKALSGGMPKYKFLANCCLTSLENLVFQESLTDYHSGFLIYQREFLEEVPWHKLSGSFDVDVELIACAKAKGFAVGEVPIPTHYGEEISHLNPVTYGLRVLRMLSRYLRGYYG